MFYRPITKGGRHTHLPAEKGVFRHNNANWTATICQIPLLRTYFLLKIKQEQFVLGRYARLNLDPWSLASPNKRRVGSWCQKSDYTKLLAISDHSEKNFFCQKYFLTRPQPVWGRGGRSSSQKMIWPILSPFQTISWRNFWPKLEEEKEKFLRVDGPIKGNTRRPHGPKKKLQGF